MTDDESYRLVIKVAALAAAAAFAPQIARLLRRIGYRGEAETDSTSWKRGAAIVGGILGCLALLLLIGTVLK